MDANPQRNRFIALLLGLACLLAAGWASADPPARVVRLGYVSGPVSFSPAGEDDWVQAIVNRPLIGGDRLWVDTGARAELQVGPVMLRADGGTSVTLLNVDDRVVQVQLAQGTLNVRVRRFEPDQVLEINTPNLAFSIRSAGSYRIDVDPAGDATTVVARRGQGEVYGENAAYAVDAGRAYRFYGTGLTDYEFLDLPGPDDLDLWASDRDRRWETSVSARYVSPDVIGYQDLDAFGTWRVEAGFGNVWVPTRVGIGWAPYRDGHWSWIEPWGWTWVDDAPWGFAVSHYGRWASVRGTWCWVPGPVRTRAVYAPALVAFVGGSNFGISISAGGVGAVGWFPLGPRDVFRPAYPVSRDYFTNVNRSNTVINVTNITNVYNNRNVTNITYANQRVPGAVVAVPTSAFVQAQPVSRAALRVEREALAQAQVTPVAAVAPMAASVRGGASEGRKPPAQVLERQTIARTAPPPASVPFAAKERLLAENPGRPLDRSAVGAMKSVTPAPAPKVQVVAPTRAAGPVVAPPTTRGSSETRGRAAPATAGTAPQAAPGAAGACRHRCSAAARRRCRRGRRRRARPPRHRRRPPGKAGRSSARRRPSWHRLRQRTAPAAPQPRATPESRVRPGATVQAPAAISPAPAVVAPAPAAAPQRARARAAQCPGDRDPRTAACPDRGPGAFGSRAADAARSTRAARAAGAGATSGAGGAAPGRPAGPGADDPRAGPGAEGRAAGGTAPGHRRGTAAGQAGQAGQARRRPEEGRREEIRRAGDEAQVTAGAAR